MRKPILSKLQKPILDKLRKSGKSGLVIILMILLLFAGTTWFLAQPEVVGVDKSVRLIQGDSDDPLNKPLAVVADQHGNVFVADSANHRIVIYDDTGKKFRAFGGFGIGNGVFNYPSGLALSPENKLYVADSQNGRVQVFDQFGTFLFAFPGSDPGAQPIKPLALAIDAGGLVYVADGDNQLIRVYDSKGTLLRSFGGPGSGPGQLAYPNGLAVDEGKSLVYVADFGNSRIQVFDFDGQLKQTIGTEVGFESPRSLALDKKRGLLYVCDTFNNRILVLDRQSQHWSEIRTAGMDNDYLSYPTGVFLQGKKLFVADRENSRIVVFRTE